MENQYKLRGNLGEEYLNGKVLECSDMIENFVYEISQNRENLIDSALLAKTGNRCQSRSRSSHSAGLSSRVFEENELI